VCYSDESYDMICQTSNDAHLFLDHSPKRQRRFELTVHEYLPNSSHVLFNMGVVVGVASITPAIQNSLDPALHTACVQGSCMQMTHIVCRPYNAHCTHFAIISACLCKVHAKHMQLMCMLRSRMCVHVLVCRIFVRDTGCHCKHIPTPAGSPPG
jgi:hypothetical protein